MMTKDEPGLCRAPCVTNSTQLCGGTTALDVYYTGTTVAARPCVDHHTPVITLSLINVIYTACLVSSHDAGQVIGFEVFFLISFKWFVVFCFCFFFFTKVPSSHLVSFCLFFVCLFVFGFCFSFCFFFFLC